MQSKAWSLGFIGLALRLILLLDLPLLASAVNYQLTSSALHVYGRNAHQDARGWDRNARGGQWCLISSSSVQQHEAIEQAAVPAVDQGIRAAADQATTAIEAVLPLAGATRPQDRVQQPPLVPQPAGARGQPNPVVDQTWALYTQRGLHLIASRTQTTQSLYHPDQVALRQVEGALEQFPESFAGHTVINMATHNAPCRNCSKAIVSLVERVSAARGQPVTLIITFEEEYNVTGTFASNAYVNLTVFNAFMETLRQQLQALQYPCTLEWYHVRGLSTVQGGNPPGNIESPSLPQPWMTALQNVWWDSQVSVSPSFQQALWACLVSDATYSYLNFPSLNLDSTTQLERIANLVILIELGFRQLNSALSPLQWLPLFSVADFQLARPDMVQGCLAAVGSYNTSVSNGWLFTQEVQTASYQPRLIPDSQCYCAGQTATNDACTTLTCVANRCAADQVVCSTSPFDNPGPLVDSSSAMRSIIALGAIATWTASPEQVDACSCADATRLACSFTDAATLCNSVCSNGYTCAKAEPISTNRIQFPTIGDSDGYVDKDELSVSFHLMQQPRYRSHESHQTTHHVMATSTSEPTYVGGFNWPFAHESDDASSCYMQDVSHTGSANDYCTSVCNAWLFTDVTPATCGYAVPDPEECRCQCYTIQAGQTCSSVISNEMPAALMRPSDVATPVGQSWCGPVLYDADMAYCNLGVLIDDAFCITSQGPSFISCGTGCIDSTVSSCNCQHAVPGTSTPAKQCSTDQVMACGPDEYQCGFTCYDPAVKSCRNGLLRPFPHSPSIYTDTLPVLTLSFGEDNSYIVSAGSAQGGAQTIYTSLDCMIRSYYWRFTDDATILALNASMPPAGTVGFSYYRDVNGNTAMYHAHYVDAAYNNRFSIMSDLLGSPVWHIYMGDNETPSTDNPCRLDVTEPAFDNNSWHTMVVGYDSTVGRIVVAFDGTVAAEATNACMITALASQAGQWRLIASAYTGDNQPVSASFSTYGVFPSAQNKLYGLSYPVGNSSQGCLSPDLLPIWNTMVGSWVNGALTINNDGSAFSLIGADYALQARPASGWQGFASGEDGLGWGSIMRQYQAGDRTQVVASAVSWWLNGAEAGAVYVQYTAPSSNADSFVWYVLGPGAQFNYPIDPSNLDQTQPTQLAFRDNAGNLLNIQPPIYFHPEVNGEYGFGHSFSQGSIQSDANAIGLSLMTNNNMVFTDADTGYVYYLPATTALPLQVSRSTVQTSTPAPTTVGTTSPPQPDCRCKNAEIKREECDGRLCILITKPGLDCGGLGFDQDDLRRQCSCVKDTINCASGSNQKQNYALDVNLDGTVNTALSAGTSSRRRRMKLTSALGCDSYLSDSYVAGFQSSIAAVLASPDTNVTLITLQCEQTAAGLSLQAGVACYGPDLGSLQYLQQQLQNMSAATTILQSATATATYSVNSTALSANSVRVTVPLASVIAPTLRATAAATPTNSATSPIMYTTASVTQAATTLAPTTVSATAVPTTEPATLPSGWLLQPCPSGLNDCGDACIDPSSNDYTCVNSRLVPSAAAIGNSWWTACGGSMQDYAPSNRFLGNVVTCGGGWHDCDNDLQPIYGAAINPSETQSWSANSSVCTTSLYLGVSIRTPFVVYRSRYILNNANGEDAEPSSPPVTLSNDATINPLPIFAGTIYGVVVIAPASTTAPTTASSPSSTSTVQPCPSGLTECGDACIDTSNSDFTCNNSQLVPSQHAVNNNGWAGCSGTLHDAVPGGFTAKVFRCGAGGNVHCEEQLLPIYGGADNSASVRSWSGNTSICTAALYSGVPTSMPFIVYQSRYMMSQSDEELSGAPVRFSDTITISPLPMQLGGGAYGLSPLPALTTTGMCAALDSIACGNSCIYPNRVDFQCVADEPTPYANYSDPWGAYGCGSKFSDMGPNDYTPIEVVCIPYFGQPQNCYGIIEPIYGGMDQQLGQYLFSGDSNACTAAMYLGLDPLVPFTVHRVAPGVDSLPVGGSRFVGSSTLNGTIIPQLSPATTASFVYTIVPHQP